MGECVIVANLGEGLYRVKLVYDTAKITADRDQLQAQAAEAVRVMADAVNTWTDLRAATRAAREALSAVLEQWQDELISRDDEQPPPIPPPVPNDPDTGEPWTDPDRAQDAPLLAAINAARTAAGQATVAREADLDRAILRHLRDCAGRDRLSPLGSDGTTAANRARAAGYLFDSAVGVGQLLAGGQTTPTGAVAAITRAATDLATLTATAYTVAGVAYRYAPGTLYGHFWGVVLATPGTPVISEFPEPDPAKKSAEETEASLDPIKTPDHRPDVPKKVSAASAAVAKAVAAEQAADKVIARMKAEALERDAKLAELNGLLVKSEEEIEVWCCQYADLLPVGYYCQTAEVPGFYDPQPQAASTTMNVRPDFTNSLPDYEVSYTERAINIVPTLVLSRLMPAAALSAEAVFFNLALEPGHLKWKPCWRYGVLTAKRGDLGTVLLHEINARTEPGAQPKESLALDTERTLTDVPIVYPPCNGRVFEVDDEVLVFFNQFQRAAPRIVGFRREPKPCRGGRVSWKELF